MTMDAITISLSPISYSLADTWSIDEFASTDTSLASTMNACWRASQRILGRVLNGQVFSKVIVYGGLPNETLLTSWVQRPEAFGFNIVVDFQHLASFRLWSTPVDVFLRLACLYKFPDFAKHIRTDNIISKGNVESFYWSHWLHNQHVKYNDHLVL